MRNIQNTFNDVFLTLGVYDNKVYIEDNNYDNNNDNMKIGVLTLQSATNEGAVLQAYALQRTLQQMGHNVEFINFAKPVYLGYKRYISKNPIEIYCRIIDVLNWKKYIKRGDFHKVLNIATHRYSTYEEIKSDPPLYDYYIVGSDQVWNFRDTVNPVYSLIWVPIGKPKISYAASMGQCEVSNAVFGELRNALSSFHAISVREDNGRRFLQDLLGDDKDVALTLDPTLLHDCSSYEIIEDEITLPDRYVCSYSLQRSSRLFEDTLKIVKNYYSCCLLNLRNPHACARTFKGKNITCTPYEWLFAIHHSECVVCNSFHAVAFSLIYHRNFVSMGKHNQRVLSLLSQFGLEYRCIESKEEVLPVLNRSIEWNEIDKKLSILRRHSLEFLHNNIK